MKLSWLKEDSTRVTQPLFSRELGIVFWWILVFIFRTKRKVTGSLQLNIKFNTYNTVIPNTHTMHTHSDDIPCNLAKHIDWRLRALLPIVGLGKSERRHTNLMFNWLLFLFQDLKENMKVHMYTVTGPINDCRNTKLAKAFSTGCGFLVLYAALQLV